jgi:hypothetical protein
MKTITLPQFLTPAQIAEAARLFKRHGATSATTVDQILTRVITPNMPAINKKLGQENDARYLAYAVLYALTQVAPS